MSMNLHVYVGPFIVCYPNDKESYFSLLGEDKNKFLKFENDLCQVCNEGDCGEFEENHVYLPNRKFDGSIRVDDDGIDLLGDAAVAVERFSREFGIPIAQLAAHYGSDNVKLCYGVVRNWS